MVTTLDHDSGSNPFPANVPFKYRLRAFNGMGAGAYSSVLTVTTDDYPTQVQNLRLIYCSPKTIGIEWDALTTDVETGRDTVIYYKLEYNSNQPSGAWVEVTSSSDGVLTAFNYTIS
jgi:hypothetical protein